MSRRNNGSVTIKIIWWTYIILLVLIVIFKFHGSLADLIRRMQFATQVGYNLVPFTTIQSQLETFGSGVSRLNLIGNIVPFIPFGILLPAAYPRMRRFISFFLTAILFELGVESLQYLTKLGSFDVDDIILNMVGIIFGYLIYRIFSQKK